MERRPISVNLRKIKINDIKTVIFFTTFKVIYISADNKKVPGLLLSFEYIRLWRGSSHRQAARGEYGRSAGSDALTKRLPRYCSLD